MAIAPFAHSPIRTSCCSRGKRAMTKLSISICAVLAIAAVYGSAANATTTPWSHEQDSDLGFRFSYPRSLFTQIEGDGKPAFHYFVSPNSDAKLMVGAWNNREGRTPESCSPAVGKWSTLWPLLTQAEKGTSTIRW